MGAHKHFSGHQTQESIPPLNYIPSTHPFSVMKLLKIISSSFLRYNCFGDMQPTIAPFSPCAAEEHSKLSLINSVNLPQLFPPLPLPAAGHHIHFREPALLLAGSEATRDFLFLCLHCFVYNKGAWFVVSLGRSSVLRAYSLRISAVRSIHLLTQM